MQKYADISAGLAYSVIKNALLQSYQSFRSEGTWQDISLYRVVPSTMMLFFEALNVSANCEAIRPDIAGIMGAFGAALIAREQL